MIPRTETAFTVENSHLYLFTSRILYYGDNILMGLDIIRFTFKLVDGMTPIKRSAVGII